MSDPRSFVKIFDSETILGQSKKVGDAGTWEDYIDEKIGLDATSANHGMNSPYSAQFGNADRRTRGDSGRE